MHKYVGELSPNQFLESMIIWQLIGKQKLGHHPTAAFWGQHRQFLFPDPDIIHKLTG